MLKDLITANKECKYNNETDETVNLKVLLLKRVLFYSLAGGESLEQRSRYHNGLIVIRQSRHLPESVHRRGAKVVVAYGATSSSRHKICHDNQATQFAAVSENYLKTFTILNMCIILFNGGSMNPKNCACDLAAFQTLMVFIYGAF